MNHFYNKFKIELNMKMMNYLLIKVVFYFGQKKKKYVTQLMNLIIIVQWGFKILINL